MDTDATGALLPAVLERINSRVSTYRCGTCDYLKTAPWREHQVHYEAHQREEES